MPTISFSNGLASGLDSQAIIDALLGVERRPALLLQARAAQRAGQAAALQALATVLVALDIDADRLARGDAFGALAARSSNEDVASATAGAGAVPGTYTVTVTSVAQAQSLASKGFDSPDASIGTGAVSIRVGARAATTIPIDAAHATLSGLRDAINASGADVTASIVNTGAADAPFRLLVTSRLSGAANTIDFTPTLSGGQEIVLETTVAAQDASVTIGGAGGGSPIAATSATNTFEDLVDGITLSVRSASAAPVTIEVVADNEPAVASARAFVDRYNDVVGFLEAQSAPDPATGARPALLGDGALLRVDGAVRRAVSGVVAGADGARQTLASVGVRSDAGGRLSLDEAALSEALDADRGAVGALFAGVGASLSGTLDAFTDPEDGTLAGRERVATRQIAALNEQIDRIDARVERRRRILEARFQAVERAIAEIQAQGAFLSARLAGLEAGSSDPRRTISR